MSLDPRELADAEQMALIVGREAAALLAEGARAEDKGVRKKGAVDLVTDWDMRSEELVRERLGRAFPGHAIVAEESCAEAAGELTWYVDPLDGTSNFVHGHPFFCVSIALCERGAPVAGAIVAPLLAAEWCAARGRGARATGRPCRVSTTPTLDDALCATGFPYDRRTSARNNFDEFIAVKLRAHGVRRCGSAAIDLAFVAQGTYDAYWELALNPWDAAAGALMVTEAGGRVSDLQGRDALPPAGAVVATNGLLHEALLGVLGGARRRPPVRARSAGSRL
jgi:myo-inositol-1(or 4)-monophosphatase